MRLKSNLYKDNYGNIFFSKTIQGERIVLPTHTKNPSTANKLHAVLKVEQNQSGLTVKMPRCKYDVKIKDFYFYDEQGTRLKILPEFLSSIFDGGVSEDEKNELVKMAIKQVEEIAKKVAKNIQSDVDKTTKATINNLIMGFNEHIDSFKFNEKNISDEQVHIENPGLLEKKLTKR